MESSLADWQAACRQAEELAERLSEELTAAKAREGMAAAAAEAAKENLAFISKQVRGEGERREQARRIEVTYLG